MSATATKPRSARRAGRRQHRKNDLCPRAWVTFLENEVLDRPEHASDPMTARRQLLTESDTRAVFRWTQEGNAASVWSADAFLTRYGIGLNEFFVWCELEGHSPWALGHPPAWHEESWVHEDLQSDDPAWRREAALELEGSSVP